MTVVTVSRCRHCPRCFFFSPGALWLKTGFELCRQPATPPCPTGSGRKSCPMNCTCAKSGCASVLMPLWPWEASVNNKHICLKLWNYIRCTWHFCGTKKFAFFCRKKRSRLLDSSCSCLIFPQSCELSTKRLCHREMRWLRTVAFIQNTTVQSWLCSNFSPHNDLIFTYYDLLGLKESTTDVKVYPEKKARLAIVLMKLGQKYQDIWGETLWCPSLFLLLDLGLC